MKKICDMAPRNNDSNTTYTKKNNFAMDDCEVKDIVPGLLHKKHKVVKLVRGQMLKIQEEGFLCPASGGEPDNDAELLRMQNEIIDRQQQYGSTHFNILKLILMMLILILLILLMVWISAGPLSNSIAHTPIPISSFVRTEGICSLEKKYLLRWSKPEYYE